MRCSLLILLTFSSLSNCRQEKLETNVVQDNASSIVVESIAPDKIFGCIFEIESRQPSDWPNYLLDHLQLDSTVVEVIPTGKFTVLVRFAVDKNGKLGDISIMNDPGYGLGDRVKEVISGYSGRWMPAHINGRTVTDIRMQPVTFVIEEESDDEDLMNAKP